MKRYPSLIRRLIAWQALALVLAWLVLGSLLTWLGLERAEQDIARRLELHALPLQAALQTEGAAPRLAPLMLGLHALGGADQLEPGLRPQFQLWANGGALMERSQDAPPARFDEKAWQVLALEIPGGRQLLLAEPRGLQLGSLMPTLWMVLKSQLGIFVWHGLVIALTVRSCLRPLRELAQRIARRPIGDLSPLKVERLYAETEPVLRELNDLLAREGRRLDGERRFLADAAHELRTPLAAVHAQAHLLLSERAPEDRQAAAAALRQGIQRVSHLLGQLLTLARVDAGVAREETMDFAVLLRERLALLAPLAREKRIELVLDAPDRLPVCLERGALCSVIDNVVDNAIRYTPCGGRVELQLRCTEADAVLRVRDNGRGIPEPLREQVFDRFYRVPGSAEQGSGLGLSIVRAVLEQQRARLDFEDGLEGRGLGLSLRWPLPS